MRNINEKIEFYLEKARLGYDLDVSAPVDEHSLPAVTDHSVDYIMGE